MELGITGDGSNVTLLDAAATCVEAARAELAAAAGA